MRACAFILAATLIFSGCATPPAESMPQARAPFWPTLSRFSGEDDFRAYLRAVQAARARAEHRSLSKQNAAANPCPPEQPDCLDDSDIAVTASRASSPPPPPPPPPPPAAAPSAQNPNITNVQNAAVDEGDIVKLVAGRFLVVLQDGRLFSVDTQNGLALVDRMNVYRTTGRTPRYAWYDEMLAFASLC